MKQFCYILSIFVMMAAGAAQGAALWVSPNYFSRALTEGQIEWDTFQVANTGDVPRGTMMYTVTTTNPWINVSPAGGWVVDGTNTINIEYDTTALTAGWYTGRVDVAAPNAGNGMQAVDVVLRVNNQPGVAWNAASRVWTNEIVLGSNLVGTTVTVRNVSAQPAGQMSYQIYVLNDPFGWVSVSNAGGISPGTGTVSYTTAGLAAGVYTAKLMLEGYDVATGDPATNGPLSMGLQLTVKGSLPALKTDQTSLSQTVLQNNTGTNGFWLWNEGLVPRGSMSYTVASDVGWATASPASGAVTNDPAWVQVVWGTTATLTPGTYSGNLTVHAWDTSSGANATGEPLLIPLTMTVLSRTPTNLELPMVAGNLFIGQTVEANAGIWNNQARLSFGYQWERAANKAGGGLEILSGQTGASYVVTTADRGKYLRVGVTATDSMPPPPMSAKAYSAWVDAVKVKALRADWNADGITDLWFYDRLSGAWHLNWGTAYSWERVWPGLGPNMIEVPGDYDGDGNEDLGVYDRSNGMWYVLLYPFLPEDVYLRGGSLMNEVGATPVPEDYDGDGATDLAVYFEGRWIVLYTCDLWLHPYLGIVEPFALGVPATGDWDGNGITEMGVYSNGFWTLRMGDGSVVTQEFGEAGTGILSAPGDYDGDGRTDLCVHDVNVNEWRWQSSLTGSNLNQSFGPYPFGGWPMPGYYDHDRKADFAQVLQSADGDFILWLVRRTTGPTNYPYNGQACTNGQTYQVSTDTWRVSW